MSLILDALRKSDRQRNRAASEQLRWAPGPARPAVSGQLLAGLAIALVLAIAGGVGVWIGGRLASTPEFPEPGPAGGKQVMDNAASGDTRTIAAAEVRSLSGELSAHHDDPRRKDSSAMKTAVASGTADKQAQPETPVINDTILHAPALSQMPEDYRANVPELIINVHAWTEHPRQRFILINMQRYAEGDRLREGPLVRQITPDGVVLEHQGETFSLSQR